MIDAIVEASHYDLQKMMVTKESLPNFSEKIQYSGQKCRTDIRSAIEFCWKRTSLEILEKYCPELFHAASNRPTNGEFIQHYAEKIQKK